MSIPLRQKILNPLVLVKAVQLVFHFAALIVSANYLYAFLHPYEYEFIHMACQGWFVINLICFLCYMFETPWHKYLHLVVTIVAVIIALCGAGFSLSFPGSLSDGVRERATGAFLIILAIEYVAEFGLLLFFAPPAA